MAVYTSNGTGGGLWSAGTTWVGGVKPPSAGGHSIVIAAADTVTYDEAAGEYGDDTTTAIQVAGKLMASRSANTSLTVNGHMYTTVATTANIDWGTVASPIPAGVTATLILNKSASLAANKYGIYIADQSKFSAVGATRQTNTTLTSGISAGATSADVADCTGWIVGDRVVFAETDGTATHDDVKTIATITPGTGTAGTITFTATTYAHANGCPVGHFSSNVTFKAYNNTYPFYLATFSSTSTNNNSTRAMKYVNLEYAGCDVSSITSKVLICGSSQRLITPWTSFANNSWYMTNNQYACIYYTVTNGMTIDNCAYYSTYAGGANNFMYLAQGSYINFTNCVIYRGVSPCSSSYSEGSVGCTFTDCKFWACTGANTFNFSPIIGGLFTRCQWHTAYQSAYIVAGKGGETVFDQCSLGGSDLPGSPSAYYILEAGSNALCTTLFRDCRFGTPTVSFVNLLTNANPSWLARISNKNVDPLVQEIYTPAGYIVRDNTSKISGTTSLKMSPINASSALTFTLQVPAPNGKKVGVSGYLNRDTANTTTVTLSGLGITPSVYTAVGSINTNEQFFVSATQTTGVDGILTLTFSTIGTSGNLWIDNVSAPQSAAIDFGEFGFWANALPTQVISASYVSAGDVWNFLTSNISVTGSIGMIAKKALTVAKFLGLK